MNIVLEKRQDILKNNDTAQRQLESILETLSRNPTIDLLELNDKFHGNLDFSILSDYGFHGIKAIVFGNAGEITSITHLPNTLEKLSINDQYLVELNDLPKSLVELECAYNHLTHLDLDNLPKLKVVRANNNKLEKISNLPESLEELYINNNEISQLTLRDNLYLRVLHCSNNKTIIIDGLPPSIVDFQCENNPYIQQNAAIDIRGDATNPRGSSSQRSRIDYYEALHQYFKMKNDYETKLAKARKAAYTKAKENGLGKAGRAKQVSKIQPKCIKCMRYVGSIFAVKNNHYIARCGDATNPCSLNIKLYRGNCWATEHSMRDVQDSIHDIQENVISTKLSAIFKYKSDSNSVAEFNALMEEHNEFKSFYMLMKDVYDKQTTDPEREQRIQRKTEQIHKIISSIKALIRQYEEEGNSILLQTAVRMQVEELNPEILNLRRLKYEVMEMDNDMLTQRFSSLNNVSFCMEGEGPSVIKW